MALVQAEVDLCIQALDRIGSFSFTVANQATDNVGKKTVRNYTQTRDALLRSFEWPFAKARVSLTISPNTPSFEWSYKYRLPDDYLRMSEDYELTDDDYVHERFEIEGQYFLSNNNPVELKYVRKVTDPAEFDSLFIEALILRLALKMISPLAGTKTIQLREGLVKDLRDAESKARVIARQETNVSGRNDWNNARKTVNTNQIDDPV